MYLPPGKLEAIAEKIATWIVEDLDRVSWADLCSGFVLGCVFALLVY